MKTALMLIATGPRYWDYASKFIMNAKKYFVPHDIVMFTDALTVGDGVKYQIEYKYQGYP